MVSQNKVLSLKIKRQAKNVFPSDVERTVAIIYLVKSGHGTWDVQASDAVGILIGYFPHRYPTGDGVKC